VVGVAEDGEEAVSMFRSFVERPKIILMDNRMPKKNGVEAAKEILQIDKNIKIIFISADDSIKEEVLSNGAFGFCDKPLMIDSLVNIIRNALA
jgi:two-component system chemotaxis response regulator CheY